MFGRLPLVEQLDGLRSVLSRNEVLADVMTRAATLELPGWYVTAGCLFQTVWNVVTGRPPTNGIKDYDVFYFDGTDLSWEAEDAVIKAGKEVFAGLPAEVEIRNEARVHLWYEQKFGVPCPPHESTEAAIDSFAATTCCLGVRLDPTADGASTRPTGSPTCSTSWSGRTRSLPPGRSMRPRRRAGGTSGRSSRCCRGRADARMRVIRVLFQLLDELAAEREEGIR